MSPEQSSSLLQSFAAWGAGGVGLIGSAALLRRRLSRDRTEIVKDRVEGSFVQQLVAERDSALAEWRTAVMARQADTQAIARLTTQNEHQAQEIFRLQAEFSTFKRMLARLYPEVRAFLGSDFPPLIEQGFPPLPKDPQ